MLSEGTQFFSCADELDFMWYSLVVFQLFKWGYQYMHRRGLIVYLWFFLICCCFSDFLKFQIMYWREAKEHLLQVCPLRDLFICLLAEYLFVLLSGTGLVLSDMAPPFRRKTSDLFIYICCLCLQRWILLWQDKVSSGVSI